MTSDLRGSGPVARLMGTAAVRAKPASPQARFNLSARAHTFVGAEPDGSVEEPVAAPDAPVAPTLPPVVEVSTTAWLQRLSIEKRIAPSDDGADPGAVAPTPASVYGAALPSPTVNRFTAKG